MLARGSTSSGRFKILHSPCICASPERRVGHWLAISDIQKLNVYVPCMSQSSQYVRLQKEFNILCETVEHVHSYGLQLC